MFESGNVAPKAQVRMLARVCTVVKRFGLKTISGTLYLN